MVLGNLDSYMQKKNEIRSPTYTLYQNKFRVDKRLKYKAWPVKVLQENIDRKISNIPLSIIFTDMSPRARDIEERINKWDLIKIKSFCTAKENSIKMKKNQPHGKTHLPMIPQTRVWSPKYIKNSHDSTPRRQATKLKNGKGLEQTLLQGGHTQVPET